MKRRSTSSHEDGSKPTDPSELHKHIDRKYKKFKRSIFWRDLREISVGLIVSVYLGIEGVMLTTTNDGLFMQNEYDVADAAMWFLFVGATLFLMTPVILSVGRMRQQHRERPIDNSPGSRINRALCQIQYQIAMAKYVVWWGILPTFGGCAFSLYAVALLQSETMTQVLFIIAFVLPLGLLFVYWCNQKIVKKRFLPLLQDVETLRNKLNETA